MRFWDTDHGKWIGHTIHEHNSAIAFIKNSLTLIENKDYDLEWIKKYFPLIREEIKRSQDAIDYTYVKLKEEYENSSINDVS